MGPPLRRRSAPRARDRQRTGPASGGPSPGCSAPGALSIPSGWSESRRSSLRLPHLEPVAWATLTGRSTVGQKTAFGDSSQTQTVYLRGAGAYLADGTEWEGAPAARGQTRVDHSRPGRSSSL